ncbi:MAG: sulfatase-like hydrolase/transferase, partial [Hungatella sp.]
TVEGISQYLNRYHIPTYHFGKTHFHCDGEYGFAELEMPGFLNVPDLGCYYRDEKVGRIHAEKRFEKIGIKQAPDHDDQVTELAVDWLKKNSEKKEPWNLDIGYLDPHFPFYVKQENWDYFENLLTEIPQGTLEPYTSLNEPLGYLRAYFKGEVATPEIIRKVWIGYYAAVAELDERIGIILDTLEELDLLKNTAIIYTSDHGEQLGYHGLWWKCCMFEQSAHIPMLIYHPEIKGNTQEHPVTLADLYPTVCEMMGLPHPDHISGESLFTLMKYGQDAGRRDFAFSEYHAHGMPVGMFMIRWDHYKYVRYEGFRPQLFDLLDDPEEDHDLAGNPEHEERIQKLIEEGDRRLRSVCDPKEVNDRAKEYQKRMKKALGVESGYTLERGTWVPHPEQPLEAQLKPNILFFMTDHQRADTLGMVQCG